jgi:hypothetical protein
MPRLPLAELAIEQVLGEPDDAVQVIAVDPGPVVPRIQLAMSSTRPTGAPNGLTRSADSKA